MKPIYLLLCLLFLGLPAPALAQRSSTWKQQNEPKGCGCYEGVYARKVGNPEVELVSLNTGLPTYRFGQGEQLRVRFYLPAARSYQLHAEDLKGTQFYWWEDKTSQAGAGWYASPAQWSVDRLLKRLRITPYNLAVLVRLGAREDKRFVPAQVYLGGAAPGMSRMLAVLRLGRPIAGGSYQVYRGESRRGSPLLQGKITRRSGGSTIPLFLPLNQLPAAQWVFVDVNLQAQGDLDPFTYSFKVYVPARP